MKLLLWLLVIGYTGYFLFIFAPALLAFIIFGIGISLFFIIVAGPDHSDYWKKGEKKN